MAYEWASNTSGGRCGQCMCPRRGLLCRIPVQQGREPKWPVTATFMMIDTLATGSACSLSHRERVGVRGSGLSRVRLLRGRNPLTPTLSHPKSGLPDFGTKHGQSRIYPTLAGAREQAEIAAPLADRRLAGADRQGRIEQCLHGWKVRSFPLWSATSYGVGRWR